jgi:hypothetical protein
VAKLTIKQWRGGAVNLYEVKVTVLIHHQSEKEATSYLRTALQDWSARGKIITGVEFESVEESNKRFFASGVVYPEDYDSLQEMKE